MQYRVEGTAAYVPARVATGKTKVKRRSTSASVKRNREQAKSTNLTFVVFLGMIIMMSVFFSVHYLEVKESVKSINTENEKLESQLMSLRSENDALLENVNNSVDWNYIKETAINKLGMKYATADQIVWYNCEDSSYIRQYRDVDEG